MFQTMGTLHQIQTIVLFLTLSIILPVTVKAVPKYKGNTKVILVSMDGFRYDYLDKTDAHMANFDKLKQDGVSMPFMNATYVTVTYPCHYSMATGLYEESHGVVANNMYDSEFESYFDFYTVEDRWWQGGEPIWASARRAGLKAGAYFWPGSSSRYKGHYPHQWFPHNSSVPYEERISTVVQWINQLDYQLALLYFEEPDLSGHYLGPDHPDMIPVLERMDRTLGLLRKEIEDAGLTDRVNLIVTSDHGMAAVNTSSKLVSLMDYTDRSKLKKVVEEETILHVIPQEGKTSELLEDLKRVPHLKVMLKEDIPEDKHYKNHRRVMPIFGEMEEGWEIAENLTMRRKTFNVLGNHGYDNDLLSMKPIFFATGPDFKVGERVDPIRSVDIYPLVCHLLGIPPSPNNGSLDRAATLLKHYNLDPNNSATSSLLGNGLRVVLLTVILMGLLASRL